MSLDMSRLAALREEVWSEFVRKSLQSYETLDQMLTDSGVDLGHLRAVRSLGANPSEKSISEIGPEWFPYSVLSRYKSFRDYPLTFSSQVEYSIVTVGPDLVTTSGVTYCTRPVEEKILILRPSEVFTDKNTTSRLLEVLGPANDGRYNVLEVLGLYHLLAIGATPARFIDEQLTPRIQRSGDGKNLRSVLKRLTVSIKRWPEYWSHRYSVRSELITEIETVLGYLIELEPTREHFQSLENLLSTPTYRCVGPPSVFRSYIDSFLVYWRPKVVKNIDFPTYQNSWHLWTTSGVAAGFRVKDHDGKSYRINKSALPIVTSKDDAFRIQNPFSKVILKAEVGKSRYVNSVDTAVTLTQRYFAIKYNMEGNKDMFTSRSPPKKLLTSANIISNPGWKGSSDIERNDEWHSVPLNHYCTIQSLWGSLNSQEDVDKLCELITSTRLNRVLVQHELPQDFSKLIPQDSDPRGIMLSGDGGNLSGNGLTTWYNSVINNLVNSYAKSLILINYGLSVSSNLFGGDDSFQMCSSLVSGIVLYIVITAIGLLINPTKSYVSKQRGEFFRVLYVSETYRAGYYARVIHSIVANNPASKAEIDIVTKLKSFWNNCSQIYRRCRLGRDYLWSLVLKLASIRGVTETMCKIPVSSGGVGITNDSMLKGSVSPGIPRFRSIVPAAKYTLDKSWYNAIMLRYNRFKLDGIDESYLNDMATGIIDLDARSDAKKKYKTALKSWRSVVSVSTLLYNPKISLNIMPSAGIQNSVTVLDDITRRAKRAVQGYFKVTGDYREYVDIMSRAKFNKFSEKIKFLQDKLILVVLPQLVNSKSAYVLTSILLDAPELPGTLESLPSDMNYCVKPTIGSTTCRRTIKAPREYAEICYISYSSLVANCGSLLPWAMNW